MYLLRFSVIIIIFVLQSCSSQELREENILKIAEHSGGKYDIFLVEYGQYTTNGAEYHNKYFKYLVGIARWLIEEKKINISENSIGFYYDKREDSKNKLYLGIDIWTSVDPGLVDSGYSEIALAQLQKYLDDVLYVIQSCRTIFSEKEIFGSVIAVAWDRGDVRDTVSIWIDQKDVDRYEKKELTFNELIQRNFVTNSEGRIIKLLL